MPVVSNERITAICKAIDTGDVKKIRLLIKSGVPPDFVLQGYWKQSLLGYAALVGNYESFCELLSAGADIQYRSDTNYGILGLAAGVRSTFAESGKVLIVKRILESIAPTKDDLNEAIVCAAGNPDPTICQLILGAGADPNAKSLTLHTPLMIAVCSRFEENAISILEAGGDPNRRIPSGDYSKYYKNTILEVAKLEGLDRFVKHAYSNYPELRQAESEPTKRGRVLASPSEFFRELASLTSIDSSILPGGITEDRILSAGPPFNLPIARGFIEMLKVHDGSGEIGLIPMSNDLSYTLMTLDESIGTYNQEISLAELEGSTERDRTWSNDWLPLASNGAGDYLLIDCSILGNGRVLEFNHETSETKGRASSLLALLQEIALGVSNGRYEYSKLGQSIN